MMPPYEIPISHIAIKKYQLNQGEISKDERFVVSNITTALQVSEQMNQKKGATVSASEINALGLINEIQHILIQNFVQINNLSTKAFHRRMEKKFGRKKIKNSQINYLNNFPPSLLRQGQYSSEEYLVQPNTPPTVLEDMFILHITNLNPAVDKYIDLFDESDLIESESYLAILENFSTFFEVRDNNGTDKENESLLNLLLQPALHSPDSLTGQLEYFLQRWGKNLGEDIVKRILHNMDLKREETLHNAGTGGSNGEAPLLEFVNSGSEKEQFSQDKDWMPALVLIAKNSYVWLDQLSKNYHQPLKTLDQIPDEELDKLSQSGITGLWLIGLWERSRASMRIKQKLGNPDAVASAYSLMDYEIAEGLGGWQALNNLQQRAWQRGIRLSADMVPNHMGIDSNWVMEHPERFLSLAYSPFPIYTFNGEDLSNNDKIGIYIEDHYYNKSDAAVVFKRVDHGSGKVLYIYHGNDGTSMPWNDTAQLDYLKAEVREAVIQTILHIARKFPIIRFDAAMTLASKHIQRLWFPQPGADGAIPSRAGHGLTQAKFMAAIPAEFWREVVDRVAREVPDTLLLAEAFWMMEGYFVRTLGMHRVYNSAFMHMLRNEDNVKYRTVIKNVLEYDPQILKRFVNFMNNPDEKTAIEQFGDGDKYFGVCTLLATLPGLPMFGHGQIEGFHEKYGMEYQRAYLDEIPNKKLKKGHEWHIFPLLKRRNLFADVQKFAMYDFITPDSQVNEDVFAFSNGIGDNLGDGLGQRAMIIYHNKFSETRGWIKTSVAFMDKFNGQITQSTLGEALGLLASENSYTLFRDIENGLEYIHPSQALAKEGLYLELGAYQHHSFVDFRELIDETGEWQAVCTDLKGRGCRSVKQKYDEIHTPQVIEKGQERSKTVNPDNDPVLNIEPIEK